MRDSQKTAVYRWEEKVVAPLDKAPPIAFDHAQAMINAIWADMGLKYPPIVNRLDPRTTTVAASADRNSFNMHDTIKSWIVLHELAHCMTSTIDFSAKHGALFVGMYVKLLVRYMRFSEDVLFKSLEENRIKFDRNAEPLFVE